MIKYAIMQGSLSIDVKSLQEQLISQRQLIDKLTATIEELQQFIDILTRRLYGKRSEKKDKPDNNGTSNTNTSNNYKYVPKKERNQRKFPVALHREKIVYTLSQKQLSCSCCGKELQAIGEEISEQLDFKPAELYVKEHIRKKYACKCGGCGVKVAPMPAQPIDKGIPGPGLLAEIITAKYQDAMPLYRQEQRFARHGYLIPRNTMVDWVKQSHILLAGIVDAMKQDLFMAVNIFCDDTPIAVQAKDKTRKGRLWVYATNGLSSAKCVIYDYMPNRTSAGPANFLADYKGYLQVDAYPGYDKLFKEGKIVEVACMAHLRRKFNDIKQAAKATTLADDAIELIARLYQVETKAKEFDYISRFYYRKKYSKPILTALYKWLKKHFKLTLPKSPINAAIEYGLNHWQALQRYLADGRLEIDNNRAERAIKPVVIGRKNYLFFGSDDGGKRAATMYSLIETCKQNNINTFEYLKWVFTKIPTHTSKKIRELLPYNYKP